MFRFLSRLLTFFHWRGNSSEAEKTQRLKLTEGNTELKTVQGVVTKFYRDHGLINVVIPFSCDVVTGGVLPKVGQKVTAVVVEDKTTHELKATKVDVTYDNCPDGGRSDGCAGASLGCCPEKDASCTTDAIYFSLNVICKGFEPYEGDRVEVILSIHPDTQSRKTLLVKPLRHKHVQEVYITGINGRNGVIDNSIFFTLDSLKLPDGYIPEISDLVNAVVVESSQSCYTWRAIFVTPVKKQQ